MTPREFYHHCRRNGMVHEPRVTVAPVHYSINRRSAYRIILDEFVVEGKIGVVKSGMDCDCTQYYSEFVIDAPNGAFEFERMEDRNQEYLDGPEYRWYRKPEDIEPQYKSADRALEAYENGHPSRVEWGPL